MSKILVCIGQSNSGPMVVNYLQDRLPIVQVIREEKENRKKFIKRRLKRYGFWKVFGQLSFIALIPRLLKRKATLRIAQLLEDSRSSVSSSSFTVPILDVKSVNTYAAREAIQKIRPDIILVVGTRIIGKKTLGCHKGVWVNIHAGITPLFRGVHGGYWARVMGEKFGTTIHFIDHGIDTGDVIFQKQIQYGREDNFLTYPYIQMIGVLADLERILNVLIQGEKLSMKPMYQESRLWTHPTIFQYIYYKLTKRIG